MQVGPMSTIVVQIHSGMAWRGFAGCDWASSQMLWGFGRAVVGRSTRSSRRGTSLAMVRDGVNMGDVEQMEEFSTLSEVDSRCCQDLPSGFHSS